MKRNIVLGILIILLAAGLRIYKVGTNPPGFYSDEALVGYEAYSLLKTGNDQFGNKLPIIFKAFGDYRPGLMMYATVPFVAVFGLTEVAIRYAAAVFSVISILGLILLTKELFKNDKVALIVGMFSAISPWSLQFARMGHETNLATMLVVWGFLFFVKSHKNGKYLLLASIAFALSMYVYYTTRLFVPPFVGLLCLIYRKQLLLQKKNVLLSFIVFLLFLLPMGKVLLQSGQGWSRIDAVSIWGDMGLAGQIGELHTEDDLISSSYPRLFHNKITIYGWAVLKSFVSHFSPDFLLFYGDSIKVYQTPEQGILLLVQPLLIMCGLYALLKQQYKIIFVLVGWGVVALLPDTLTRFAPAAARIHLALPIVSLLSGFGLTYLLTYIKRNWMMFVIGGGMLLIIPINIVFYLHSYYVHLPVRYAKEWHYGVKDVAAKVLQIQNQYDQVWLSNKVWGWTTFLFYIKYPPDQAQKKLVLSEKNEFGLGWVYDLDTYHFAAIPQMYDYEKNILYVGAPDDFVEGINPIYTVNYPDSKPAFYFVTTAELKRRCPLNDIHLLPASGIYERCK